MLRYWENSFCFYENMLYFLFLYFIMDLKATEWFSSHVYKYTISPATAYEENLCDVTWQIYLITELN